MYKREKTAIKKRGSVRERMRMFHISDLHIGKQLHAYNLYQSQRDVLGQIVEQAKEKRPDVILIAGDIYDKAAPSGEAYELFDWFLSELAEITPMIPVLIIAGNHDNAQRLKFASGFLKRHQIYVATMPPRTEEEHIQKIVLQDTYGEVNFYLLPFTKPGYVRQLVAEEKEALSYDEAIKRLLDREQIDLTKRNVLLSHQFYVANGQGPEKSDSELTYISVGGLDSIDIAHVQKFDYVALGHIHKPQQMGESHIRYCGTPYKYSVSEERDKKGILMVELGEKGSENQYERIPLIGNPDVRSIKGTMQEVLEAATEENRQDYVSITLTDDDVFHAKETLEEVYPHILEIHVDNERTRKRLEQTVGKKKALTPMEAFMSFYQEMNDVPLSAEEETVMLEVLKEAQEEMQEK